MKMNRLNLFVTIICVFQSIEAKDGPIYFNNNVSSDQLIVESQKSSDHNLVTQTVYGFLDFTTTIGNTVMVFSPKSSISHATESSTTDKFEIKSEQNQILTQEIKPTKTLKQTVEPESEVKKVIQIIEGSPISEKKATNLKFSSKVEIITSFKENTEAVLPEITKEIINLADKAIPVGNNLNEPEYDFLSRQPSEFVEETFKVVNLKAPTTKVQQRSHITANGKKTQIAKDNHPTGLVTKLGGTVVKDGATTVHETSVIGTYISGKYAQVLQSSSHIYRNNKPKISTSPTLRILKTAPPLLQNRHRIEPTSRIDEQLSTSFRGSRRSSTTPSFRNRFKTQIKDEDHQEKHDHLTTSIVQPQNKKPRRNKPKNRRNKNSRQSSVNKPSNSVIISSENYSRRTFKPKIQQSSVETLHSEPQTSLYKFKLNRAPGRWQYKTSAKPRIAIRKSSNSGDESDSSTISELITNDIPTENLNLRLEDTDLESSGSVSTGGAILNNIEPGQEKSFGRNEIKYPVETLNVEISTPVDFKDTYYEIATIKTPYTFQVGTVKNTRFITVTSTFEKKFEPEPTVTLGLNEPLTENILASTTDIDQEHNLLESSIATLSPLYLSLDGETPELETKIETFSTTQEILKTHILPIIRNESNTTSITLVQTYHVTRFVTATKTLPPLEAYQFVPSKQLKEFNSKLDEAGSELNIELDFGDENEHDDDTPVRRLFPDSNIEQIGSDLDLIDVKRFQEEIPKHLKRNKSQVKQKELPQNNLSPEQLQQLAFLRLINPGAAAQLPQPVLKVETIYESHVIPIFNGQTTSFSTISRPVSTIRKTEYEFGSSTLAALPIQQQMNPLFPQQFHITTAPIFTQTLVTETRSKILKLTFGAKTAYTTLFSTNIVPTVLTTFVTTSIQVQPTAGGFPGYFPSPFAPYPFVG